MHYKNIYPRTVETQCLTSQKRTIIFIILSLISLSIFAQPRTISLTAKNAPIKQVFAEIQQKSGYRILYNDEVVADDLRVSVTAENVPVKNLLQTILANTDLTFLVQSEDLIVITKKEFAAPANRITGMVLDENNEPVPFANVVQLSLPDSTFINGVSTAANGRFSLERASDKPTLVEITFLGYERFHAEVSGNNNFGAIRLQPQSTQLGEVVIQGKLPSIRIVNDALVTTVQNTVLSKSGTGNDVLKRLPLLTGDNGVFSVFGKGQAKIYINNREMRDVSELDILNSSDIKNVEIVSNPGARYDGSVKAVIRINTLRKAGDGFGFNVRSSYFQSQNVDLTEQLNLNFRKNGWDVFGTLAYYQNQWFQDSKIWQKNYADTLWRQDNTLLTEGISKTLMAVAGINYEINDKHYTGLKYTLSAFPQNKTEITTHSSVFANDVFYDNWSNREEKYNKNKPSHQLSAYYNGSFGELNVDFNADYYTNKLSSHSTATETSQEFENRLINSINNVTNQLMASKLVLSYPVLGGSLSVGSEYTNVRRKDDYSNKQGIVPSSNTTFHEANNGFFTEYSHPIPGGQIGAGLRYESVHSDYFVNGVKNDEQSRKYGQWFPNVSLSTKVKGVGIQLSYTAKTRRPTYRQLNSNVSYLNRFTLEQGNPFLTPSIIHDITLVSTWKFLNLMVSYKNVHDIIIYWMEQKNENPAIAVLKYRNFDKVPFLTTYLTVSPKFGVWSPQFSAGLLQQWFTITSNNKPITLNKPIPVVQFNNSFSLPKGFLVTCDLYFQGKGDAQNNAMDVKRFTTLLGVTKSFFDDKLSIALKGHDLFYGQKDGQLLYNEKIEWHQFNKYDSRKVELTVRYKFNTARSKYKGTGAGNDERNRL